jgi:hypothetical protein
MLYYLKGDKFMDDQNQALKWDVDEAIYISTGSLIKDIKDIAFNYEVGFLDVILASALNLFARFVL